MTVWRLWEWAPISSMMSPVVGHACCARRAPSFRGWTPSPGRAVPVFSVSEFLFAFLVRHNHANLRLFLSLSHTQTHTRLFLLLACFTPSGLCQGASVTDCRAAQEKTVTDCLLSFLFTASSFCLQLPKESLC